MKYSITNQGNVLNVRIDEVSGQEATLLQAIQRCRHSAWACPSGECRNIGSMEERAEVGSIFLTLTPRPGAVLDRSGIEECLRYMLSPAIRV
jgi:hypothetical protein